MNWQRWNSILKGRANNSGNGAIDIFSIWEQTGFSMPVIEEYLGEDGPAKTIITLPLVAKTSEKAPKKKRRKKATKKDYFAEKLPVIQGKVAQEILKATMILVLLVCHSYFISRIFIHDDFKASNDEALSENERIIVNLKKIILTLSRKK